jgi:hypothetical protein
MKTRQLSLFEQGPSEPESVFEKGIPEAVSA